MKTLKVHVVLLLAGAVQCHLKSKSENQPAPVNSFQMIAALPNLVVAYTSSPDPVFLCMDATLTYYNAPAKEATYVWHFKSSDDHKSVVNQAAFHITEGSAPGQVYFSVGNDESQSYTAYYNYTDYKCCLVTKIPYDNEDLCMLAVRKDMVDTLPQDCLAAYGAFCSVWYRAYDSDICEDSRCP